MNRFACTSLAVGLLALVSAVGPTELRAQRSGVEIWSQTCGRCHTIQPANRYTADQWESIMANMMILARMTDSEAAGVLEFLRGGARQTASAGATVDGGPDRVSIASSAAVPTAAWRVLQDDARERFRRLCVACHGAEGRGDGPAAVALNPKPTDLTDAEFQASRTDESLSALVRDGRGTMPGFGRQLSAEQIEALVAYVRELGRGGAR